MVPLQRLVLDTGEVTPSRRGWVAALLRKCSSKHACEHHDLECQRRRLDLLSGMARCWKLDGLHPPTLDLAAVLFTRPALKAGTAAGTDGVVSEIWRAAPLAVIIQIWQLFSRRIASGSSPVNEGWKSVGLIGLPTFSHISITLVL